MAAVRSTYPVVHLAPGEDFGAFQARCLDAYLAWANAHREKPGQTVAEARVLSALADQAPRAVRGRLKARVELYKAYPPALNRLFPERHPNLSLRCGRDIKRIAAVEMEMEALHGRAIGGELMPLGPRAARIYGRVMQWEEHRMKRLAA